MARKRVKLAFKVNDSVRKATYKKKKNGMMKKLKEICTVYGIEACAIVYKPHARQPDIWPSPEGVKKVLSRFAQVPELDRRRNMMNPESYLSQMIRKAKKRLEKIREENRQKEKTLRMYQYLKSGKIPDNLTKAELKDLANVIDQQMKEIKEKMAELGKAETAQSQSTMVASASLDDGTARNKGKAPVDGGHGLEVILDVMKNKQ
ncbi:agamous-like MADS-box protein AGL80 [Gastrolobium bilobum]|uniref:agamous-like MADS-box protein AGL80 n=1 Tax=Gastrolobium bilobum TaxID=150636 RepID=UPI002AB32717|nr:agamous-like MADS-box protein AGL80 [Gastrolobium bilobum]